MNTFVPPYSSLRTNLDSKHNFLQQQNDEWDNWDICEVCTASATVLLAKQHCWCASPPRHSPDSYRPTVYENTGVEVFMDGVPISLGLWDTAGNDTFRQIRPMSYQQADVVLLCYSVANPNTLTSIQQKWIAEVREHLPRVPVLVVGTQTDHREMGPYRDRCTTASDGKRVAHEIRAKGYLECSALINRGIQQVFECAVRTAINQARKRTRRRLFDLNPCRIS